MGKRVGGKKRGKTSLGSGGKRGKGEEGEEGRMTANNTM